jgi:large subunit ribosomal protein L10
MATSKSKKKTVLELGREVLAASRNLVLTEYRGISVADITALRAKLRKAGVKFRVMKNTLLRKLLGELGVKDLDDQLKGPVAVAFLGKDVAGASKVIIEAGRKNEKLVIKSGYIEGKVLGVDGLKALASLPPREVLLSRMLGSMLSPVRGFLIVAQGNTQKLVYVLNALKAKKAA